jgi:hypothetical protein
MGVPAGGREGPRHAGRAVSLAVAAVVLAAADARADTAPPDDGPPPARVTADDVTLDAHSQALALKGHVDVEAEPFHLTSDLLRVTRSRRGLVVEGDGRVAFCPCLGEPVALVFRGATVAPPGDLFLTQPRLEVAGVPIFWLPYFWLRSAGRVGLVPPDIAYRGHDGFFFGDGVHVPWRSGDTESGLDVRAGGYVDGGAAVESTLRTPISVTTVRWDDLHQSGLAVDARGSTATSTPADGARSDGAPPPATTVSWDADLLRGARGVASTTDLDAAARVFDRAAAEASWRGASGGDGWVLAAGAWAENVRGSGLTELDAGGPIVRARDSGTVGSAGTYDATLEGGTLGGAGLAAMSFGRADAGALLATRLGVVGASLSLRGAADVAAEGEQDGHDSAASARLRLALPFARTFAPNELGDPLRHRIEPEVEVGGLAAEADGLTGDVPTPGALRGAAWLADAGVRSALGRWGARRAFTVAVDGGGVGGDQQPSSVAVRWRAAASAPMFGLGAEGADVAGPSGGWGHALTARARVGAVRSFSVALLVAGRAGVDPVLARALTDAPLASSSGFLAAPGWTSGARVTVPITGLVTLRGGADGDLTAEKLVAARGSLEVHDRCQCVAVRLSAAERLGREGVDVWLSVDLVPRP